MQMNSETKERSISYSMANEQENLLKIRTALVSVHDKRGLLQLGEKLVYFGAKIIATGELLSTFLVVDCPRSRLKILSDILRCSTGGSKRCSLKYLLAFSQRDQATIT